MQQIETIYKTIMSKLNTDIGNSDSNMKESLDEESEIVGCDKCSFSSTVADDLRKHIVENHTKMSSKAFIANLLVSEKLSILRLILQ